MSVLEAFCRNAVFHRFRCTTVVVYQLIAPSMISTREADDVLLSCKGSRQSDRNDVGFCTATQSAEQFYRWIIFLDKLSQFSFINAVQSGYRSVFSDLIDSSISYCRPIVSENCRTSRTEEIDVSISINII